MTDTSYGIFRVRREDAQAFVESPDWVNVIARTLQGHYVLVRQVRHGLRREMVETPGGRVDPGEDPEVAARRELLEETGYASDQWRKLGQIHPNPTLWNNLCHVFLADACGKICEPEPDGGEEIFVEIWSPARVRQALRDGEISDSLVVASFFFLDDAEKVGES